MADVFATVVTAMLDVGNAVALRLAGLGDAGEHGERAAKRKTTDGDANQLVHDVHLSL